jgi:hypothetical protein
MFRGYNVTSNADQVEALRRTAAHLAALPKSKDETVVEMPHLGRDMLFGLLVVSQTRISQVIPLLESARIHLREWRADELEVMHSWLADPEVMRYLTSSSLGGGAENHLLRNSALPAESIFAGWRFIPGK